MSNSTLVFVIEDSVFSRNYIKNIVVFIRGDVEIVEAASGEEAVNLIRLHDNANDKDRKVVITIDYRLENEYLGTKMNGIEVIKTIRSENRFKDAQIIMLSESISEKLRAQARHYGVRDILTKDDNIQIIEKLKEVLL